VPDALSAAILIGGRARRFDGRIKPLLPIGGRPIVTRQIEALRAAGVDRIALIGRWLAEEPPPGPVVADAVDDGGALGGLYTALLVGVGEATLVLAGDLPFVTALFLRRLAALGATDEVVVPRTVAGLHPLCGCYRRSVALKLKQRLDAGALRVREAIANCRVREIEPAELSALDPDGTMLMNVNTPADYERARHAARDCA
jgi:molybdopterin-guanine dinucleotide biosynthesis protein A